MGKYGECASLAVGLAADSGVDPRAAWDMATLKTFPHGISSRKKGCPKGAFLGLCEDGLVKGIPKGEYTMSLHNKRYAVSAVQLLRQKPQLSSNKDELWRALPDKSARNENGQVDVVIRLWNSGLITRP
jgi:hypothetical protein